MYQINFLISMKLFYSKFFLSFRIDPMECELVIFKSYTTLTLGLQISVTDNLLLDQVNKQKVLHLGELACWENTNEGVMSFSTNYMNCFYNERRLYERQWSFKSQIWLIHSSFQPCLFIPKPCDKTRECLWVGFSINSPSK